MKNKYKSKCKLLLSLILCLVFITTLPVSAGNITTTVSVTNEEGELNVADWYDPNDELEIKNGILVIPNGSSSETRIITKILAEKDDAYPNMAEISCNVRFTSLPDDEYFSIGFGLDSIESYSEEPDSTELVFKNNDGLAMGAIYYDADGNKNEIAPFKRVGSVTSPFLLSVILTCDGHIKANINGKEVLSAAIPESCEGRIGFLQSGNCGAEIKNLQAVFHKYERPQNSDYVETFEEGVYNDELFTTAYYGSARSPAGMNVEEYGSSKVLMYRNAGRCYFGTKQQYSNFELTFDIPYISRETKKDEDGNIILVPCGPFCISFGDVAQDFNGWQFTTSTELVHFTLNTVWGYNHNPEKFRVPYSEMGFFDPNTNEGFSVKIKMVDGNFSLGLKKLADKEFKEVATAYYDNFRTGYIKFWSTGESNIAIDNISLKNLDSNPKLTEAKFTSALIEVDDFKYEKIKPNLDDDSRENVSIQYIWIILSAGVAVLILVASITVRIIKSRKGRKTNEA
ncbi:MAG: hypothetical protein E7387_07360 [Ruminococcaceae bacterium]|nr:hypothetical protein [Oscillospiraceae bacterium]